MVADNDLSSEAIDCIETLKSTYTKNYNCRLVVFADIKNQFPCLIEINEDGIDIITEYTELNSCNGNNKRMILTDIDTYYNADKYNIIFWSHGSSWLPSPHINKSFGIDGEEEMNITTLANSLPFKFGFIAFDACYMASVEVAYELKNKAEYMLASTTSLPYTGFPYKTILHNLLDGSVGNLKKTTQQIVTHYNNIDASFCSTAISLINLNKMSILADEVKQLLNTNPTDLTELSNVWSTDKYEQHIYFDFADFISKCIDENISNIENILNEVIVYYDFTEIYTTNNTSGIICSAIADTKDNRNFFYKKLKWSEDTGWGIWNK